MKTSIRLLLAASLVALLPHFILAQFTIDQILSAPMPSNLAVSDDGAHVAWVFNAEGVRNIWIYDAAEQQSRQLTAYDEDDGQAIGSLQFAPDGETIYFVRGGGPNRAGEIPNPTSHPDGAERAIHAVDIQTGEVTKVADGSSPSLSADGQWLAYSARGGLWLKELKTDSAEAQKAFEIRGGIGNVTWNPVAGNK